MTAAMMSNADTRDIRETTVMPPQGAEQDYDDLYAFLAEHADDRADVPCLQDGKGQSIPVPREIFNVLVRVSEAMKQGKAVSVVPVSMTLTTSQAADMLGISRQTLVRLLEKGEIPFEQPSRHRKIRLTDLLAFKHRRQFERRHALDEMTRMAAEDNLYDDAADSYASELVRIRKSK